jgi:hypothetical protein
MLVEVDKATRKRLLERCGTVQIMVGALGYVPHINSQTSMMISFDGKDLIKGNAAQFVSLSLISGIMACRVLLEFLGIKYSTRRTALYERLNCTNDDLCIEQFQDDTGYPLKKVAPCTALQSSGYQQGPAKEALELVIKISHKEFAHLTTGLGIERDDLAIIARAGKITMTLIDQFFFAKVDTAESAPRPCDLLTSYTAK